MGKCFFNNTKFHVLKNVYLNNHPVQIIYTLNMTIDNFKGCTVL